MCELYKNPKGIKIITLRELTIDSYLSKRILKCRKQKNIGKI